MTINMSYGLTPYDKKSYKESKKRRKQALRAAETGRILPYGTIKRRVIAIICVVLVVLAVIWGAYALILYFSDNSGSSVSQSQEQYSEELLNVVNKASPLESDYVPELKKYNAYEVNAIMFQDLTKMADEAEKQGTELKIRTAYISYEDQQKLYEQKLSELLEDPDYTEVRAQADAQKSVPKGGESEFQTGLLIDFDLSDSKTAAFIERSCVNYGFILRYPQDKEDITRMSYRNSVYRYVGNENAVSMRSYNMCLEEYVDYLETQKNGN